MGITPGIGKRDALSGGPDSPAAGTSPPVSLALQERGRVKIAKGFPSTAGEKLLETVSRGEVENVGILTYGNSFARSLLLYLSNEGACQKKCERSLTSMSDAGLGLGRLPAGTVHGTAEVWVCTRVQSVG